MSYWN